MTKNDSYFKLIRRSGLVANSYVADQWSLSDGDVRELSLTGHISVFPADAWVKASSPDMDGEIDDFVVNDAMLPIISRYLKELLGKLRLPGWQALPISLIHANGNAEGAWVLNFTETIGNAIDIRRSKLIDRYSKSKPIACLRGKINSVWKVAIKHKAVLNFDLFRLTEYPSALVASEAFKQAFAHERMSGVTFSPVIVV